MTQSQIQYFLAVAQEMSISKAADQLYVSQPAVSKQVSLLEEELGVSLFRRINNKLEITDAGRAYETLFSDFHLHLRETMEKTRNAEKMISGNYYLGCIEGWDISPFYPQLSEHLKKKYPKVNVMLTGYNLDQMKYVLRRGEADGVIASEGLFIDMPEIKMNPITQVGSLLLYSGKHPLARKKDLKFSDFKDFPFLVTVPQGMKHATDELTAICKAYGFMPKLEYTGTLSSAFMKIRATTDVLLTTDWIMAKSNPIFRTLALPRKRNVCLATLADRDSEVARTITQEIVSFFEQYELPVSA